MLSAGEHGELGDHNIHTVSAAGNYPFLQTKGLILMLADKRIEWFRQ